MDSRRSPRAILEGVAREVAVLIFRSICPVLNRERSNSAWMQKIMDTATTFSCKRQARQAGVVPILARQSLGTDFTQKGAREIHFRALEVARLCIKMRRLFRTCVNACTSFVSVKSGDRHIKVGREAEVPELYTDCLVVCRVRKCELTSQEVPTTTSLLSQSAVANPSSGPASRHTASARHISRIIVASSPVESPESPHTLTTRRASINPPAPRLNERSLPNRRC